MKVISKLTANVLQITECKKLRLMNDKKQIQAFLLGWAIGAIIFTFTMAYVIGVIDRDYKQKIDMLERKCK